MHVLAVVDRVLGRFLLGQFQVEIEVGIRGAHGEEESAGVLAHLVHDLAQADEFARAFGHLDRFLAPVEVDELVDDGVERLGRIAQRRHRRLHARHVAVVVRAPDVYGLREAPRELVLVIGDVRKEVSGGPVGLDEHPVLVVFGLRRARGPQPDRALFLIHHAPVLEFLERGFQRALGAHLGFQEPPVEVHAEGLHVLAVGRQQGVDAFLPPALRGPRVGFSREGLCQIDDILPLVAAFRRLLAVAPGVQRKAEALHLLARVVDVELRRGLPAQTAQDADQGVAQGGAAAGSQVQGARRVGGYELDEDLARRAMFVAAVARRVGGDRLEVGAEGGVAQPEVHEAGGRWLR